MPSDIESNDKVRIFDLNSDELVKQLCGWGWPAFRAEQVLDWVYRKQVHEPGQMSNLSRQDRGLLGERFTFGDATVSREQISSDGTVKLLLKWGDGRAAETVMIPDGERYTACVSSQVGCPVGCRFCASGVNGLQGNLSPGQIVEQIVMLNNVLKSKGVRITNVVFMGMGEPLANYANVTAAMRILHDPKCFDMGARRITVSTVGVPGRIRNLAEEGLAVNLALSLHAPNEALRRQLIPWADHFALNDILEALRYYFERTGREVTLEYILLAGVNDQPEHARELTKLCRTLRANVNLIRYNEVPGLGFGRPKSDDVMKFQEILVKGGVNAHVRKSRGRDIDAACGQLRRREAERMAELTVGGTKVEGEG
ncbi:MAG TPA: 23S rRNA (adenine(2503)-C(2))-methyltransferase RlmN, partial [Tepidisphaeraceae bacterium]|nr:23S rRNA (adenine(2503)-C(2))-methyltransferase RlmN [Tepidisphaeraceae bacterium]